MPEKWFLRPILTVLLRLLFRVEVRGLEHVQAAGGRVLVIANHQSFLDPLLLAVFMPHKPAFAMNVYQADKWYFRWVDTLVTVYKLDPLKPLSMKRLIQDLRKQATVVLFPEGRITTTGGIMKVYEGAGLISDKTDAALLPVRIDGAEYSHFSRMRRKLRLRWFPKITLTFFPPKHLTAEQRQDKRASARAIYDILVESAFASANYQQTLLGALLEAQEWHGSKHIIASDISRVDMSYRQLLTRAFVLSGKLADSLPRSGGGLGRGAPSALYDITDSPHPNPERNAFSPERGREFTAVLLPNGLGALVTFFSLHILGHIPCMLNFSSGEANLLHACRIAGVKTVLTSRLFVEKGKLETVVAALQAQVAIIYLEDIRAQISLKDKLTALWKARFARHVLHDNLRRGQADDPAAILYTSGSEGRPKGVALSHANILANVHQARARLDLTPRDILFNALPVFHSFGLSIGMLLPVLCGIKTFLYPSPLHYRIIPDLAYDTDATVMLGTDTFFTGYARYAHPYDFSAIRLAVAGAEKLKESTRHMWADKFRVNILQGYGVTETAPAIAFNTPMEHKEGTVGRPFPAIECMLEPVAGLEQGGKLLVRGPNVMLGYLDADAPGTIKPHNGWYDTGDIVSLDAEGFITIQGRAKRFAKIGGEMVSLQAVEDLAAGVLPDAAHAALSIADERKGEQIVLYTEAPMLEKEQLIKQAKASGIPEIYLPKKIVLVEQLPRLGTGKVDYVKLKESIT